MIDSSGPDALHTSEQLKKVIDSTVSVISQFITEDDFNGDGMECQTMVLDSCENILSTGNEFISKCQRAGNQGDTNDAKIQCVQAFSPNIERRVKKMSERLAKCLDKVNLNLSADGQSEIVQKIKESIHAALRG